MERVKHHYCWLKVVNPEAAFAEEPSGDAGEIRRDAWTQISWTHGHGHGVAAPSTFSLKPPGSPAAKKSLDDRFALKPPPAPKKKASGAAGKQSGPASQPLSLKPPAVATSAAPLPPRMMQVVPPPGLMFGGATFMGCWQFEQTAADRDGGEEPGPWISCQPVLGTRQEAQAWLDGPEGRAWRRNALSVSLLAFVAIGEL